MVRADRPADVAAAFDALETGRTRGLHAAGFLAYELGYALEPRLAGREPPGRRDPLLWFGLFRAPRWIDAETLDQGFAGLRPLAPIADVVFGRTLQAHVAAVEAVQRLIAAGDLYQANLTLPVHFRYAGDPLALYAALRVRQPTAFGGCLAFDDAMILTVSPELFVEVRDGVATSRPMKGTAARGAHADADAALRVALPRDPKQRAENLMITDLIRNDLSRIARPGTVRTPALFTVETYPTFHALTSTVVAELEDGLPLRRLAEALFPCGSIVGAPKIRAAEVIAELEAAPRGVYTGAIGAAAPGGDLRFNVAIRTAVLRGGEGVYGVGGGIVFDSDPEAEYAEAVLKAKVLTDLAEPFDLIETLRWTAAEGFVRLAGHLDRMGASARRLGFRFDRAGLDTALADAQADWTDAGDRRVRIALSADGAVGVTATAPDPPPDRPVRLHVSVRRLDAGDPFLRHKTSRRAVHEAAYLDARAAGADEALLLNRAGRLADGARNSVFVAQGDRLATPPLEDGALPGVLRATLLGEGRAVERSLRIDDLADTPLFIGNSLHGLRPATRVG